MISRAKTLKKRTAAEAFAKQRRQQAEVKGTASKHKQSGRARVRDKAYLAFIASQPCLVTGERPVTVHHVRSYGSARDDRRTVPLVARLHMRTNEEPGRPCVERGKRIFERFWNVDIEEAVLKYNRLYETTRTGSRPGVLPRK